MQALQVNDGNIEEAIGVHGRAVNEPVAGVLMTSMFRMMPASMRKNAVSKDNAPNPAKLRRDLHDEFGETPYKTEEVVPGKVDI